MIELIKQLSCTPSENSKSDQNIRCNDIEKRKTESKKKRKSLVDRLKNKGYRPASSIENKKIIIDIENIEKRKNSVRDFIRSDLEVDLEHDKTKSEIEREEIEQKVEIIVNIRDKVILSKLDKYKVSKEYIERPTIQQRVEVPEADEEVQTARGRKPRVIIDPDEDPEIAAQIDAELESSSMSAQWLSETERPTPPFLPALPPGIEYTLVLDLDETLIHYKDEEAYYLVRPGVAKFLQELSQLYDIVLFTASVK